MKFKEKLEKQEKTFIVGVAGDSGSGKTTFVSGIEKILGSDLVSSFSLDDYHILDREERKRKKITPLDPRANNLDGLARDLRALKARGTIQKPVYDHRDGKIKGPVEFTAKPVLIIEGLHPMYSSETRDLIDFAVFVEPDRKIKKAWKLKRDIEKRGHEKNSVLEEMKARAGDYERYIDPQKVHAEVHVRIEDSEVSDEEGIYMIKLQQRILETPLPELDLTIDLSDILRVAEKNFRLEFQKDEFYGHPVGILGLDGLLHREVAEELEKKLCRYTGKPGTCIFHPGKEYISTTELAQLIICWRFLEKINYLMNR